MKLRAENCRFFYSLVETERQPYRRSAGQPADQTDPTCRERTAQDPPQTRFGKIASLFGHGPPVVRRERDSLTLRCDNEYLHYKHRSDNCPAALERGNGH